MSSNDQTVKPEPLALTILGTSTIVAYACGKCRTVHSLHQLAERCCTPHRCEDCGAPIEIRYRLRCDKCESARSLKHREDLIAKATRVALADYPHAHVCLHEDGGDGSEDDYPTVETAIDDGHEWAWAVSDQAWPHLDASDILYGALESSDLNTEARDWLDVVGLQKLLDEWLAAQGPCRHYMVDTSRIVQLMEPGTGKNDDDEEEDEEEGSPAIEA